MKMGLTLMILANAFTSMAMAAEGDVSYATRSTTVGTDVVQVQACNYSPIIGGNGQLIARATINYLECVQTETYQVQVTQGKYWSSSEQRVAGSEKRSFALVARSKEFTDYNSMLNNGQEVEIDPDLNGDGKVTMAERREANQMKRDRQIEEAIGDVTRTVGGHMKVQADCSNFANQLRLVERSYNQLAAECRR